MDGGRFQNGSEDFTSQISKFKAAGCDIVSGVISRRTSPTSGSSAIQQGFKPMANTMAKALLFPSALEALGDIGYGLSSEVWWSPSHPVQVVADRPDLPGVGRRVRVGHRQAVDAAVMHYEVFEVVVDALKRTTNVDDKQVIVDAIKATDIETIAGHITWSAGAPLNPVPNVCARRSSAASGQGHRIPFELMFIATAHARRKTGRHHLPSSGTSSPSSTETCAGLDPNAGASLRTRRSM